MLKLSLILCVFEKMRKGEDLIVRSMFNYIESIRTI